MAEFHHSNITETMIKAYNFKIRNVTNMVQKQKKNEATNNIYIETGKNE